jgi:hypothetical protein
MTPEKESLYQMTIDQYEAIRDSNLGCHRVELIKGVMHCRETGNLYRFQPDEFQALVERGILDPTVVSLVDGYLVHSAGTGPRPH